MKEDTLYLIHIAECLDRIDTYAHGVDRQQFMQSTLTQDAILRNLQVLAESTQRLSDTFKSRHPEVEWYKIAGLRNILVHDYLGIDLDTVWNIIEHRLPELRKINADHEHLRIGR